MQGFLTRIGPLFDGLDLYHCSAENARVFAVFAVFVVTVDPNPSPIFINDGHRYTSLVLRWDVAFLHSCILSFF